MRLSATKTRKVRVFLGRKLPNDSELKPYFLELDRKSPRQYKAKWLSSDESEQLEDLRAAATEFYKNQDEPLPRDFIIRFTYNTNAIEGNPLTLRQTALILADNIVPQGARTEYVMEVLNGKDAWEYSKNYEGRLNSEFVCHVQYEVTKNTACRIQGSYRDCDVGISGSQWKPPQPGKVPNLMKQVFESYQKQRKTLHPIELASWLHNQIAQIHPFTDGNGRTARLLMNWALHRAGFPPAVIEVKYKEEYYSQIEEADKGNQQPFAKYLARLLFEQYTLPKAENASPQNQIPSLAAKKASKMLI
ncbi:MAG: Fic family protein [Candidatus Aenigmarchaeota archaeon]|nr:Fic family protein [Candidatus Aenigmarchaeota archaeon]